MTKVTAERVAEIRRRSANEVAETLASYRWQVADLLAYIEQMKVPTREEAGSAIHKRLADHFGGCFSPQDVCDDTTVCECKGLVQVATDAMLALWSEKNG